MLGCGVLSWGPRAVNFSKFCCNQEDCGWTRTAVIRVSLSLSSALSDCTNFTTQKRLEAFWYMTWPWYTAPFPIKHNCTV